MIAVRDNDLAAQVLGVNVFAHKLLAFGLSTFYAGIAGGLFAVYFGYLSPTGFTLIDSIWYVGMLVIGGMHCVAGAVFGTLFVCGRREIITAQGPAMSQMFTWIGPAIGPLFGAVVFSLILILFIIFEPRGLAHLWDRFKNFYRMWPCSY